MISDLYEEELDDLQSDGVSKEILETLIIVLNKLTKKQHEEYSYKNCNKLALTTWVSDYPGVCVYGDKFMLTIEEPNYVIYNDRVYFVDDFNYA